CLPAMSGLIDCITMRSVMWRCWFMMP
ncbi:diguanylate cyclase, partial [Escherichia coli]|nr:diguanylate cyclase [Escherichia coli]